MKTFQIVKGEIFKQINQWVEIFKNGEYQTRMLVGVNQTDKEIIDEYYNQVVCEKYLDI
jgi:hypothetical protein